ncbi:cysteine desulfurase [Myxococcota bacterium]|nr:cysteine desulfurase [Myxococcota bacterium]
MEVPRIYLDHNATTPVRGDVVEIMAEVLREVFGNPSSVHAEGEAARRLIDDARQSASGLLGVDSREILFTGGATEANNTALWGVLSQRENAPGHIVTSRVEHPSVEAPLVALSRAGWRVTRVPVNPEGRVDAEEMLSAIEPGTALVSLIWANNETGTLQPVAEVAAGVRDRGILMHTDATQALGKVNVSLEGVPVDLLSASAHKFGGPKGVGMLVHRGEVAFDPILRGGPQEKGRRGGTENVAGITGLGVACTLAVKELDVRVKEYERLRDRLWEGIRSTIPKVRRNGSSNHVLPNTLNVEFENTAGEVLVQTLDLEGVSVSAGAACASGSIDPSPTLVAMGRTPEQARGSVRMSVGHGIDDGAIDRVLEILPRLVHRVRGAETR